MDTNQLISSANDLTSFGNNMIKRVNVFPLKESPYLQTLLKVLKIKIIFTWKSMKIKVKYEKQYYSYALYFEFVTFLRIDTIFALYRMSVEFALEIYIMRDTFTQCFLWTFLRNPTCKQNNLHFHNFGERRFNLDLP